MSSKNRYIHLLLIISLILSSFTMFTYAQAGSVDSLADRLIRIYNYLDADEKKAVWQARQNTNNLSVAEWEFIIGKDVMDIITNKSGVPAHDIITDIVEIIYATPETDFKKEIDNFRTDHAGHFDKIFGSDVTVDMMIDFFEAFEANLEKAIAAAVIFGSSESFDQVVKNVIEDTIDDGFEDLDGKLSKGIGIGIEGLFDIKDRLNEKIDPDKAARSALIAGIARGKGAKINGPDSVTAGSIANYTFTVTYQNNIFDLSDDVAWVTDKPSIATVTSKGVLTAKVAGTVKVQAQFMDITVLSKTVSVAEAAGGVIGGGGGGGLIGGEVVLDAEGELILPNAKKTADASSTMMSEQEVGENGQQTANVSIDETLFMDWWNQLEEEPVQLLFPVAEEVDRVKLAIPSGLWKHLWEKEELSIVIATIHGTYILRVQAFDPAEEAGSMGVPLEDVQLQLIIERTDSATSEKIQHEFQSHGLTLAGNMVSFTVQLQANSQIKTIQSFGNVYVDRIIKVTGNGQPEHMTGVVFNPQTGQFNPVPTIFQQTENGMVALLKRNGNSIYTVVASEKTFSDTASHWAADTIETLASKLIINGMNDTQFKPEEHLTRAQLAAMVVRALGLTPQKKTDHSPFADVEQSDWFAGYVNAAVEAGIIEGYPDKTYQPDRLVTREQTAAIMMRAMKFAGYEFSLGETERENLLAAYADQAQIDQWAREETAAAVHAGILSGYQDSTVRPDKQATRAEAAVFIHKMMKALYFIN